MRSIFEINYRVEAGQQLCIDGDICLTMTSSDGVIWRAESRLTDGQYRYQYCVCCDGDIIRREERDHSISTYDGVEVCYIKDSWSERAICKPLESSLFTKAIFRRPEPKQLKIEPDTTVVECRFVQVEPNQCLAVVGESYELGHWNPERALVMSDGEYPIWRAALPRVAVHTPFKFVILDSATKDVVAWEMGDNHILVPADLGDNSLSIIADISPVFDLKEWRGRGVAIPIFSLRTERSMGVGDFGDIRNMVDWAVERGMSVIQILPINDTTMNYTWEDSYPYNANSTIALHPHYLALRDVGMIDNAELREEFEREAREIDALSQVDYNAVNWLKMRYLREVFSKQILSTRLTKEYRTFIQQNSWWLESYALFSALRDRYKTPDFKLWGDDAIYSERVVKRHSKSEKSNIEFYYFVQFHLHKQLLAASEYARSRGVALKGDIPIGISRTSVDAWVYPELFNMGMQAGAPPDPFSALGQNWGFPTYNWERMAEDGYRWWRSRFEKMSEYFDAYRIDHILGFFRIWEIPLDTIHGLTGYFNPALPMSVEEIESYGFSFNLSYIRPYITDETLTIIFDSTNIDDIKGQYFEREADGIYSFKEGYNTQKEVAAECFDEEVCSKLLLLHNEVLFVEDRAKRGLYHPRILASESMVYNALSQEDKDAFRRLHDNFYYRRHNDFWRDSALRKLPTLVAATEMLVCGEDLGMIPDCVAEVMHSEQILSLEIERMPKGFGLAFDDPSRYPYLSVCTCSTHDMNTIRGWWREDRALTQRYYSEALRCSGEAPIECSGDIARRIIERHINTPAMLTILPWQDWMSVDEALRYDDVDSERINIPAKSRHYWRYRVHMPIKGA